MRGAAEYEGASDQTLFYTCREVDRAIAVVGASQVIWRCGMAKHGLRHLCHGAAVLTLVLYFLQAGSL